MYNYNTPLSQRSALGGPTAWGTEGTYTRLLSTSNTLGGLSNLTTTSLTPISSYTPPSYTPPSYTPTITPFRATDSPITPIKYTTPYAPDINANYYGGFNPYTAKTGKYGIKPFHASDWVTSCNSNIIPSGRSYEVTDTHIVMYVDNKYESTYNKTTKVWSKGI